MSAPSVEADQRISSSDPAAICIWHGHKETSEQTTLNEKDDPVVACSRQVLDCGLCRTQIELDHRSENTLEFSYTIAFPQNDKLKRLSFGLA